MKYILYCDLKTIHCHETTLERLIKENSSSYLQISKDLWAFEIYEHSFCWEFQCVPEYYIRSLLSNYLDENSICFIHEVDPKLHHADYNLPQKARSYLFETVE